jgi:uncharacterized protein
MDYTLFVLIGLVSSIASAVFGFGNALLLLAIGSHILPVKETIALATVLFVASTVTKTFMFGRHIDWKVVAIMTVACLPFAYLGAQLLAIAPAEHIKRGLGAMVLIYLGLSLTNRLPSFKIGTAGLIAGSALYGFVSGLLGTGNVIKVVMFREMNITKEAFVGAMAATSVMSNFAKIFSYSQSGLLHTGLMWPALALVASAVVSAFIGRAVLRKINLKTFETGVQLLLGAAALALMV